MLEARVPLGGHLFFSYTNEGQELQAVQALDKTISAIKSGLLDNNEMTYLVAGKNYVEQIGDYTLSTIYRYGLYLVKSIAAMKEMVTDEAVQAALHILKKLAVTPSGSFDKNQVVLVFLEMLKSFVGASSPKPDHDNEHELVAKAKEFIYHHYSEPISLALIAEKVGVSASYLSNIFHKSMNESYIKFLTRVRMEQAAKLLKARPAEKVVDVSEKVGYVSVKHFSHVFKQHFHMPPGEYQDKQTSSAKS
jgi:two-component system response regulator YesN